MNRQPRIGRLGWLGRVHNANELAGGMPRTHAVELDPLLLFVQKLNKCHHGYTIYGGQPKMTPEDK